MSAENRNLMLERIDEYNRWMEYVTHGGTKTFDEYLGAKYLLLQSIRDEYLPTGM